MTSLSYVARRLLLLFFLLFCSLLNFAQALTFIWGKAIGGNDYINLGYSVIDATGNVYLAGTFGGTLDYDPGPGSIPVTSIGDVDAFVSKLDSAGNLLWAIQLGSPGADRAEYVTVDALGNVYVTGSFSGTVDFDPGPGTASLTAAAGTDAFVAKYDANGSYVWATSFSESDNSTGKAVGVDALGNVYVAGNFSGTISFTTGSSITSLGGNDVFIAKLNSSGAQVWGEQIGGSSADNATGIVADALGNVYTVGNFENGTIDLDPGPGTVNYVAGTTIAYLVKLNTNGGLVWAINSLARIYDLKTDATANLYMAGGISNVIDMDPGPGVANIGTPRTSMDYYWILNSDGGYVFAKSYFGVGTTGDARSASVDATGNIYTAGGQGDFNKWDKTGNPVWGFGYGVNSPVVMNATDAMQHVYTAGNFHSFIDLDPGPGTATFTYSNGIFINKLSQAAAGPLPLTWISLGGHLNDQQQAAISFTVNEENVARYTIEKSTDGNTFSNIGSLQSRGNGAHSYVYTEPAALHQTAWYRILQTDVDGRSGYSIVIRLTDPKVHTSATVFPVPSVGNVTVQITAAELLHTRALLIDMKGRVVKTILINDYTTPVSLDNLPGGMYLLQLANGSSLKIMKQE